MGKVNFFYANGTSYLLNLLDVGLSIDIGLRVRVGDTLLNPATSASTSTIAGLNGKTYEWDCDPKSDPFPFMLNSDVWNPVRISYPADFTISGSIDVGVTRTINLIKDMAPGAPFALGGYSQGAAVMSEVYKQIKDPAGELYSRRNDFLGGVCFGNPERQIDFRGEVGGTWSGYWNDPNKGTANAATSGGGGCFPSTGKYSLLTNCDPTKWIEFVAPDEIVNSTGRTQNDNGIGWVNAATALMQQPLALVAGSLLTEAILTGVFGFLGLGFREFNAIQAAVANAGMNFFVDAAGKFFEVGGKGHTAYGFLPPPDANGNMASTVISTTKQIATTSPGVTGVSGGVGGVKTVGGAMPSYTSVTTNHYKANGLTSYQVALQWLESKAAAYATAPIIIPSTGVVGWSTTLTPPAS